jgi:hypothetical protein
VSELNTFRCNRATNDYVRTSVDYRHVEVTLREGVDSGSVYLTPSTARALAASITKAADEIDPRVPSRTATVTVGATIKVNRNGVAGTGCRVGDRLTVSRVNLDGTFRTYGGGVGAAWHFHTSAIDAGFLTIVDTSEAPADTAEVPHEGLFRKAKALAPAGASTADLIRLAKFLKGGE